VAINATTVWEFRAGGTTNAGGGFDSASGGTDYSQQDAAQLQLTDLATSGIGVTTLTSATGGFTSAMIGNYIQIRSGTNVTAGWYRMTAHTDTNTVTLDRAPDDGVGGISGGSGDLGGAIDLPLDAWAETVVAGNKAWIKAGTYTLTENIDTDTDGSLTAPIVVEGYNTTRGDEPTGTNRPLIAAGAYFWRGYLAHYWHFYHLRGTGTANAGAPFELGNYSRAVNVKCENSSGTSNRIACRLEGKSSTVYNCELISTNGYACASNDHDVKMIACVLRDSAYGFRHAGNYASAIVLNCVIDTCTTGLDFASGQVAQIVMGCVIYNSTTGILVDSSNIACTFLNNIITGCTTGASDTSSDNVGNLWDHNAWFNTTDVSNVTKGPNAIDLTVDPFVDSSNDDFNINNTSGGGADLRAVTLEVPLP
tara:strand:- start:764 stop:2029 length:1266 start_codon:yes stop_codon:yes gene_type:complete